MPPLFYYKDGPELRGPFEETDVLSKYKMAEFSSDYEFQIRPSVDEKTPFTTLRALLRDNGHWNPFRNTDEEMNNLIAAKRKKLDELSARLATLRGFERRIEQAEKRIEEKLKQKAEEEERKVKIEKIAASGKFVLGETNQEGPGLTPIKDANDLDTLFPFIVCDKCKLVCISTKQIFMHLHRSSCKSPEEKRKADAQGNFAKWKKEDEQRLAAGQRLYKKLTQEEIDCARPQIDFVEDLQQIICKKIKFKFADGHLCDNDKDWLRSDEAKKMSDRFVKHLEGAKRYLVCTRCFVACRTHLHFIKHLLTYDHRLKVKGQSMEQLTLLLGYFYKALYLEAPDPSELDEDLDVEGDQKPSEETNIPAAPPVQTEIPSLDSLVLEDNKEKENAMTKEKFIEEYSQKIAINCEHCDLIFSTYKQWLLHCTTEEHEDKAGTEESARLEELFDEELQKWRWEDRVKLSTGKRMYESMSEEERKEAGPPAELINAVCANLSAMKQTVGEKWNEELARMRQGKFESFAVIVTKMEQMMTDAEKSLQKKKAVCHPCKVAFDEPDKYFVHCQMSKHLLNTASKQEKYLSMLISFHKKDLYFK